MPFQMTSANTAFLSTAGGGLNGSLLFRRPSLRAVFALHATDLSCPVCAAPFAQTPFPIPFLQGTLPVRAQRF